MSLFASSSPQEAACAKALRLPRELLIVWPGAFTTGWLGPTARVLDIAHGLTALGWGASLLAGPVGRAFVSEARAASAEFPGPIRRTPFSRFGYPTWLDFSVMQKLSSVCGRSGLLHGDPELGWGTRAAWWYLTSPGLGTPDLIWAVSDWTLSGPVAARLLAKQMECPWVLELEDPWPAVGARPSRRERESFAACLQSAAAIVTTTQSLTDRLASGYPACREKMHTFHLTFDASVPRTTSPRDASCLRLVHVGSIYGGRRSAARSLISAIAQVQRSHLGASGRIRLHLIGGGPRAEDLARWAAGRGLRESVFASPQVPPGEALQAMDQADVLVVIKFADSRYHLQIPGKTFQYLGRGKPILGMMEDCEAAEILRRSGLGVTVKPDDVDGIARRLLDCWRWRDDLPSVFVPDWDYIAGFSRDRLAQRLDTLFLELLAKQGGESDIGFRLMSGDLAGGGSAVSDEADGAHIRGRSEPR